MPRYAKKQTSKDFETFMNSVLTKNVDIVGTKEEGNPMEALLISFEECIGCSKVMKDLSKYDFYYENVILKEDNAVLIDEKTFNYNNFSLLGFQEYNGLNFYGVLGGSDYGLPLFFILYQDDKNTLRGYIPGKGNALNPLSKSPFGEDDDADEQYAKTNGFLNIREMEEKKFTFLNKDFLLEDIIKRIILK
jgi:hypothetical protein